MYKEKVLNVLQKVIPEQYHPQIQIFVPEKIEHGDFTTNIAMIMARPEKKAPVVIAEEIKSKIRNSNTEIQIIDRVEVAGNGYLNFFLTSDVYSSVISDVLEKKDTYGSNFLFAKKRIMVEYGHPNPFKTIHIGHLRNFFIGESICRLLEFEGAKVIRTNYQGDVGMHVAKCVWALKQRIHNRDVRIQNIEKEPVNTRVKLLSDCYVTGAKAFEENKEAKKEITAVNKAIYTGIDKEITKLWKLGVLWSLEKFGLLYKRLGTFYERQYMESETLSKSAVNVAKAIQKGILVKSKGATVFIGEPYGLDTRVFLNSENLPTYEGKELGLAEMEFTDFGQLDLCIHNVAVEQKSFFAVTFKVEELLDPLLYGGKQYHNAYEFVGLKKGKMSSRKGEVVTAESILDEAFERIKKILHKNESALPDEQIDAIAVGAVRYSFLRMSAFKYLAFDLEASLSFKGDSGPYLQYAFTRCKSVLSKSEIRNSKFETKKVMKFNTGELKIVKRLAQFENAIELSVSSYSPHHITSYLNDLAQEFSTFYNESKIAGNEQRVLITEAVAQVLKNGLYLLGIKTVNRM